MSNQWAKPFTKINKTLDKIHQQLKNLAKKHDLRTELDIASSELTRLNECTEHKSKHVGRKLGCKICKRIVELNRSILHIKNKIKKLNGNDL